MFIDEPIQYEYILHQIFSFLIYIKYGRRQKLNPIFYYVNNLPVQVYSMNHNEQWTMNNQQ